MPAALNSQRGSPELAPANGASNDNGYTNGNGFTNGNGTTNGKGITPGQNKEKPLNILYIMADQLAAPVMKIYNPDSIVQTPNIDALAAKSVQFDSAYCPSPLCGPSRMSMITGQLPMKIGAYDNAAQILSDIPTYAHHLRFHGYQTVLAGKMHFVMDQKHGYEKRLTTDIYPGDFGWAANWDADIERPEERLEWYHNASSIEQAGACVRSNQLDYDEEVMYKSTQFLHDYARSGDSRRPFCLTVSLTHPHDPYTIEEEYWDKYENVEINLPKVPRILNEEQDPHSRRLLKVCDLWDKNFTEEQIKRARRAYYGAVSYVDDCVGKLLKVLEKCRLADDTIIVFSGDHGDMLGERGLWYKMSYFESSVRVPLLVSYPKKYTPHRVTQNVSTLDILPTMVDLIGKQLVPGLPMDGQSLLPFLEGRDEEGHDTAIAEYTGEGTVSPIMMIKRANWKFVICPADGVQLFDLKRDPLELEDLTKVLAGPKSELLDPEYRNEAAAKLDAFQAEAKERWDFNSITEQVLLSQRKRRFVWSSFTAKGSEREKWDFDPIDDGREKYIRSHMPLDDLERMARYPLVDANGNELPKGAPIKVHQAGAFEE